MPKDLVRVLSNMLATGALGGMTSYLRKLNLDKELIPTGRFMPLLGAGMERTRHMILDAQALSDLNILEGCVSCPPSSSASCLFNYLNHCKTPFGRR